MKCPTCDGRKLLDAHVNYGGSKPNAWEKRPCLDCCGTGEVSEDFAERRAFGRKLTDARVVQDESLYECARRCGLKSSHVSAMEHGRADPKDHPYYGANPLLYAVKRARGNDSPPDKPITFNRAKP